MIDSDLLDLDATAQAELVRSKEISPRELVSAAIRRIQERNKDLNAVIHERFEEALLEADVVAGAGEGPFAGVPFLLKDLDVFLKDALFHGGMECLKQRGYRAPHTSSLVSKFQKAGLVILGQTNTPELGLNGTTEPKSFGPTHNPWHLDFSPGGSSGGSAAAVAAGMVPMAHASDGGGSIRIPASACGLVGLKPSRGRISMAPEHGDYWHGFVSSFVVTRSVRDSAAMLDAVAGSEPGDPYTATPQSEPYLSAIGSTGKPLKIGLMTRSPKETRECHADCVAAVEAVGRQLESQGHHVEVAHPVGLDRHKEVFSGFNIVVASWVAKALNEWSQVLGREIREGDVERSTLILAEKGRAASAADYLGVIAGLQSWSREIAQWWAGDFDLLVTPTLSGPPVPLGSRSREVFSIATFTTQWNITGQPAISVPLGMSESGLPIGVQLVSDVCREDVLFRIASDLEQAMPWSYPGR